MEQSNPISDAKAKRVARQYLANRARLVEIEKELGELKEANELLVEHLHQYAIQRNVFANCKSAEMLGLNVRMKATGKFDVQYRSGKSMEDALAIALKHHEQFKDYLETRLRKEVLHRLPAELLAKLPLKLVPQPDRFYIEP